MLHYETMRVKGGEKMPHWLGALLCMTIFVCGGLCWACVERFLLHL